MSILIDKNTKLMTQGITGTPSNFWPPFFGVTPAT